MCIRDSPLVARSDIGGVHLSRPVRDLGVPESIREVIGRRLDRLGDAAVEVLETAAEPIDTLPVVHRADDDQISRFPAEHLALFYAVLPENAQVWPWGVAQVVEKLAGIASLKNDSRLSELRRRLARI